MAEARLATAEPLPPWHSAEIDPQIHRLQLRASHEGMSLFIPHPRYWMRYMWKLARRVFTKIEMAFAPVPLPIVVTLQGAALYWYMSTKSGKGARTSWLANKLWDIDKKYNPWASRFSNETRVGYITTAFGVGVVATFAYGQRQFLKLLLSYQSWMLEDPKKPSFLTMIWGALMKKIYMNRKSTRMLAYQSVLPHQPVPAAGDTVRRYLKSMKPILSEEEYADIENQANTFLSRDAWKTQLVLMLKWCFFTNYISDWWLDYIYLRGRSSIFINSNFYGLSIYGPPPSSNQASRAAVLTHLFMEQRRVVESERVKPLIVQGLAPLCMQQYVMSFSTTREPHPDQDRLVQYENYESRHVCVIYKGHYFALPVYDDKAGTMLSPLQLEAAYQRIIDSTDADPHPPMEQNLAALTTDDRSTWSAVRTDIIQRDERNRKALDLIERSIMVVTLWHNDDKIDWRDTTTLARTFFFGDGRSQWCDKSANLVVCKDGHVGLIGEHAWADAPVLAHLYDAALGREHSSTKEWYDDTGRMVRSTDADRASLKVHHADRIQFHVTPQLTRAMNESWERATEAIKNSDHICVQFPSYGKGVIKACKCSPDAWVQNALQLAYFRKHQGFVQTYESGMARLYKDGRTETVRSATTDSCNFVRAMEDATVDRKTVADLLAKSCDNHHHLSIEAMTGKGVDRHLFALYCAAHILGIESDFLVSALKRGWKLSTSQTPAGQAVDEWKPLRHHLDTHPRPGGGFGPVADDGYGVSYTFTGDNWIFFHVSSKVSCEATSTPEFFQELCKALDDMAALFPNVDKKLFGPPASFKPDEQNKL